MRPRDKAVITMWVGILAWDLTCPPHETISEAVDDYLDKRPLVTTIFIGLTAAHLLNRLPAWADVFALFFAAVGRSAKQSVQEHLAQPS